MLHKNQHPVAKSANAPARPPAATKEWLTQSRQAHQEERCGNGSQLRGFVASCENQVFVLQGFASSQNLHKKTRFEQVVVRRCGQDKGRTSRVAFRSCLLCSFLRALRDLRGFKIKSPGRPPAAAQESPHAKPPRSPRRARPGSIANRKSSMETPFTPFPLFTPAAPPPGARRQPFRMSSLLLPLGALVFLRSWRPCSPG
jgi:hypothetical protein